LCRDYIQVLASMYVCFSKHRSIVGSSFPGYLPLQATRYQAHYFFFLSLGRSSKLIPWNLRSEYQVCPTDLPRRSFASASLFRKEFARLSSKSASRSRQIPREMAATPIDRSSAVCLYSEEGMNRRCNCASDHHPRSSIPWSDATSDGRWQDLPGDGGQWNPLLHLSRLGSAECPTA